MGQDRKKRAAIVTGAAGGLGADVAQLLAESGHDLMLVDIQAQELVTVTNRLAETGSRLEKLVVDLSSVSECERVVTETITRLGKVDILVNSAAILARMALADMTAESFDHIFHINCRAPFFLCRAAIADMEKRHWGRIVNITSIGVYQGGYNMTSAPYEGTKGAVSVFTKMFAKYGAARGVLVNSVCPGGMRTRMNLEGTPPEVLEEVKQQIPLKRLSDPIEVARMVVWLCGDENSYATGATFDIIGGRVMH